GGVRAALSAERREHLLGRLPEARATARQALGLFKGLLDDFREEAEVFGKFPSLFLGLVSGDGSWEHYDGTLRFVDDQGRAVAEGIDPARFGEYIGESVEPDSFLKSPYYKPLGYPQGAYRVGPLARLNVCRRMGVPLADRELAEFRQRGGGTVTSS